MNENKTGRVSFSIEAELAKQMIDLRGAFGNSLMRLRSLTRLELTSSACTRAPIPRRQMAG